jgi:hypothetical protein
MAQRSGKIVAYRVSTGGATSLRAIAEGLNQQGIPTARGSQWSTVQVARVLERIG